MKITSITVGKSVQVFQIGLPERWDKLSMTAELGDGESVEESVVKLRFFIDRYLEQTSPAIPKSGDITFFNVTTQKEEK